MLLASLRSPRFTVSGRIHYVLPVLMAEKYASTSAIPSGICANRLVHE